MNFKSIGILLSTVLLTLSSCYNDIDLGNHKDENGENLLSLNSIVNPDSTLTVMATRTFFFTDSHKERVAVEGLDITMTINESENQHLRYDHEKKLYVSDFKPQEGDRIELSTKYKGQTVKCRAEMPRCVEIESVTAKRQGPMYIFWENDYMFTYHITFSDRQGEKNYYFLRAIADVSGLDDTTYNVGQGQFDYSYEFVFQQLAKTVNATVPGWKPYGSLGLPFSDDGIDGKTYTLTLKEVIQNSYGSRLWAYNAMQRQFRLYSISKDYYDYLVSIICADTSGEGIHAGMIDIGIAEPSAIHNNIDGGVGIFGAYSMSSLKTDIFKQTGAFPRDNR